jgi:uncharacterized surface anchored protein
MGAGMLTPPCALRRRDEICRSVCGEFSSSIGASVSRSLYRALAVFSVGALLGCALTLASPFQGPSSDKCTIGGRVVDAASGQTLRRVSVRLFNTRQGAKPLTTVTDDAGNFSFDEIDVGTYTLDAERTGYSRQVYGARAAMASGTRLSLVAGQHIKDLLFKLIPNGAISGRVLDEDGEPLPRTLVSALRTAYIRGGRRMVPVQTAASNDLGEFRIGELKPGRYVISARPLLPNGPSGGNRKADDPPEPGYTTTFYPGSSDPASAVPIDLGMGADLRGIDIRLTKIGTFRVRGRLAGVPLGARPMLSLLPTGPNATSLGSNATATAAPPDWSFEFKGLAPGLYVLSGVVATGASVLSGSTPIEIGNQHVDGVVLSVGAGGYAELQGKLALSGVGELKGATVSLEPADAAGSGFSSNPIDADGRFVVRAAAGHRYYVRVSGGPETAYVKSVRWRGEEDITERDLDLTTGVSGSLQITLSATGAGVEGSVRGADDKPIAGATVVLIPDSGRYTLYRTVTTDQNGAYSITGIAPGEYKMLAWEEIEPGAYEDPAFVKPFLSKAQALSLRENDRKSCSLVAIAPN